MEKSRLSLLIALSLSALVLSCGPAEEGPADGEQPGEVSSPASSYIEDEVIVRLGAGAVRTASAGEILPGAVEIDRFTVDRGACVRAAATAALSEYEDSSFILSRLRLPAGFSVPEAIERLRQDPSVQNVEPNYRVRRALVPNDPFFPKQWGLANTGQTLTGDKGTTTGKAGADIGARNAWDLATGDGTVVVAVVDSGIDGNHPDLIQNVVSGWNFINNTGNANDDDVDGHGTHVAGIIGAAGGDGVGIGGINWRVQLMPLKFLDRSGNGTLFDAVEAIRYAIGNGARVINASYTYPQSCVQTSASVEERNAIADAGAAGILVVTAAGNFGCNNDATPFYPASHPLDNILAVAATDPLDNKVSWSNYGLTRVHLGAPGLNIYSTVRTALFGLDGLQGYDYLSGTSMASPFVAGAAALLWSRYPDLHYREIRDLLLATVDPLPSLAGKTVSGGRLNLARALQADLSLIAPAAPAELEAVSDGAAVELSWRDLSDNETEFIVERAAAGEAFSQVARVPANENFYTDLSAPDGTSQSYRVKALAGIRASDPSNEVTIIVPLKAPGGLSAIATSGIGIDLAWTAPSARAESHSVERRLAAETDFTILGNVPVPTTTFRDATALPGESYVYRVRAYSTVAGFSADSPEVTASLPASSTKGGGSGGGSGCFIATAAWGSAFAPEVAALRHFRDRVLLHYPLGRRFVATYYRLSPPVAGVIADSPLLKQIVRTLLWPVARLASLATPAAAMERRPPPPADPTVIEGELLVRFRKDVPEERVAAIIEREKSAVLDRLILEEGVLYRLRLPAGVAAAEAQSRFSRHPEVLSAEPNRRIQIRPPS